MKDLVNIGGISYKECDVVITEMPRIRRSWSNIFVNYNYQAYCSNKKTQYSDRHGWYPQYMHVICNDELKVGDWAFDIISKSIFLYKEEDELVGAGTLFCDRVKKLIATTDKRASIAQPSIDFMKIFSNAFNSDAKIKKVFVEYEPYFIINEDISDKTRSFDARYRPVINNNIITIKPVRNSRTRDEIIKLIKNNLMNDIDMIYNGQSINHEYLDKWIVENLYL